MAEEVPFRILLCDDEPVIRELVRTMLSSGSVAVDVAPDGVECLKAAKSHPFDLILLDIVLPGMDGITVCRLLKSDPATARVPIYMLTAKVKQADVESARRAGADGYINKPFRGAELMDLVDELQQKRG
ncbi:MAG: response regulator [Deltaproteobacteria bacterium]|nr:response regulator [Deltaproteobacteria bacterium]